ncbi:MAG: clostripain-related cysteine peptidase [Candidatus Thermoplasmatota archaeon]|nr:clostripain-related cysteine peptidase [Candidatus Thermoplasmatota archaeon]
MKKNHLGKQLFCMILITVFVSGVGQAAITTNNLSAAQGQVLQNIRACGASEQVAISVLIDQNTASDTKLYYLDGTTLVQQTWPAESSMDDPATLVQFVTKIKDELSAENYALFISSNKGCGWQGVCWDEHGRGQMITMPELLDALNQITSNGADKLDILGIETCMTGNMEVAYQINSCVRYFIAYPECGMLYDWPYVLAFTDLKNDPSMTPSEFCVTMVDHFVPHDYTQDRMKTTMAATNLSYVSSLEESVDGLAVYLLDHLDEYQEQITTALESARVYARLWYIDYYIDFYDFLDLCTISDPEFTSIREEIQTTMDTAVIANNHLSGDPVHGLSIYFPRRAGDYNDSLRYETLPSPYEQTNFAMNTHWDEFLREYLGITNNSAPAKPSISGPAKGKPGVTYEYTLVSLDPEDQQVSYFVDWGDGTTTDWLGPFDSGTALVVNHTWDTKQTFTVKAKAKDSRGAESEWATLPVKIPFLGKSRIWLVGSITSLDKSASIGFRFLPIKVLEVSAIIGQDRSTQILTETYGEYPCCGYLPYSDFRGIITQRLLLGVWVIPA